MGGNPSALHIEDRNLGFLQRTPQLATMTAAGANDLNLNDVLVFVHVVRVGSFTEAASTLNMAKSSVSRSVSRLENHLGARLLHRNARALTLTEAGAAYHDAVGPAMLELLQASTAASTPGRGGTVRLTAPDGVAAEALPALVTQFVSNNPGIGIDVHAHTTPPSIVEDGFDLAIVGGRQPDSALVIRKLRSTPFRLFAAPTYLDSAGAPTSVADLSHHACVLFNARSHRTTWHLHTANGVTSVAVTGSVTGNSLAFVRRVAIAGLGIALLPEIPGRHAEARGLLRGVLAGVSMRTSPLYLVAPSKRHVPEHVALFRDFLLDAFPCPDGADGVRFDDGGRPAPQETVL